VKLYVTVADRGPLLGFLLPVDELLPPLGSFVGFRSRTSIFLSFFSAILSLSLGCLLFCYQGFVPSSELPGEAKIVAEFALKREAVKCIPLHAFAGSKAPLTPDASSDFQPFRKGPISITVMACIFY